MIVTLSICDGVPPWEAGRNGTVMDRDQSLYRDEPKPPQEKPHRIDNRPILAGSTYFVPNATEQIGFSTFH